MFGILSKLTTALFFTLFGFFIIPKILEDPQGFYNQVLAGIHTVQAIADFLGGIF